VFQRIGRRLALLNATVVIAIIVATGGLTYVALSRSLDQETDRQLRERIAPYRSEFFEGVMSTPPATPIVAREDDDDEDRDADEEDDDDHEDDEEDREVVASGDTIVFLIDSTGAVISNTRELEVEGLHEA
jgi:hypothetical protein